MQAQPAAHQQPVAQAQGIPVDEETVNNLIAISGYSAEHCRAALQAAMGDPNRAFDFLSSGMMMGGGMQGVGGGLGYGGADAMMEDDGYGEEGEDDGNEGDGDTA
jgi:hypothetical protein